MSTVHALANRLADLADAATAPHGLDHYLEQIVPTWSRREVRARIVAVDRSTPGSVTLRLHPNRGRCGFTAGQHTQVGVDIDGVRHTRCYSLAGSEHDSGPLELTIRAQAGGVVSTHLVTRAVIGDVVVLSGAQGEFTLPAERPERLLLVSGGSGITPVMSMLRTLCDEGYRGEIAFVHYALTAAQMIYRRELEQLASAHPNVRLLRSLTDEPGAGDLDGFLDAGHLEAAFGDWHQVETYVCGPAPLMDAAGVLFDHADAAGRLHTEAFTLPQLVAEAGDGGGSLRFASSEAVVANDGRPILAQAEDAGLRPVSGCRMGICHTCIRPLRCGTVRNAVTGDLHTVAAGAPTTEIQVCVNVPVGDVVVDL